MSEPLMEENTPAAQPIAGLSFRGLVQVFTSPTTFFRNLKEQPKILVPYIVLGILCLIFFIFTADLIVKMQLATPQMQERLQGQAVSDQIVSFMKMSTIGGGTIAFLLTPLIAAAFALFFGNFVFAGKAKYKQLLSVMIYGEIIFSVGMLLTLPMIIAKDSMLVSYSLAVLVSQLGPENILYVLLSKISVFHIWEFVVVGIGLSAVYDISQGKGFRLSMLSIGFLSILHVVITAIAGLFK